MAHDTVLYIVLFVVGGLKAFSLANFEKSGHFNDSFSISHQVAGPGVDVYSISDCATQCSRNSMCTRFEFCQSVYGKVGECTLFSSGTMCQNDGNKNLDNCTCYKLLFVKHQDTNCHCPVGYHGNGENCCKLIIKDCTDGQNTVPHLKDKGDLLSYIKPTSYDGEPFQVLCHFGYSGLTVIQARRLDGRPENFNRSWEEYKKGFGHTDSNFWLGFDKVKHILNNDGNGFQLDFDMTDTNNDNCQYNVGNFNIGNEASNFTGTFTAVGHCSKWCEGSIDFNNFRTNGKPFSTFDHDSYGNGCPAAQASGWWFGNQPGCSFENVNSPRDLSGIKMKADDGGYNYLKMVQLKLKRLM